MGGRLGANDFWASCWAPAARTITAAGPASFDAAIAAALATRDSNQALAAMSGPRGGQDQVPWSRQYGDGWAPARGLLGADQNGLDHALAGLAWQ